MNRLKMHIQTSATHNKLPETSQYNTRSKCRERDKILGKTKYWTKRMIQLYCSSQRLPNGTKLRMIATQSQVLTSKNKCITLRGSKRGLNAQWYSPLHKGVFRRPGKVTHTKPKLTIQSHTQLPTSKLIAAYCTYRGTYTRTIIA